MLCADIVYTYMKCVKYAPLYAHDLYKETLKVVSVQNR